MKKEMLKKLNVEFDKKFILPYKTLLDIDNAIRFGELKRVDIDLRVYRGKKILYGFSPRRNQYYICFPCHYFKFCRCEWYAQVIR